ncbi:MAG TPA: glycosyltransferase family protein [Phenylobacterium sp.]|nr:glycosyltransferase family protein [Phenylobacterium sp.]
MILGVIQARMSSSRLPGKVLAPVLDMPMIGRQVERLRRSRRLDDLVLATSVEPSDSPLADYCASIGLRVIRGPLADVLARFALALDAFPQARTLVRLTADCPLTDWRVLDAVVDRHRDRGADYTANTLPVRTFPHGLDVEVAKVEAFRAAVAEAADPYEREHVMPFLYRNPQRFRIEGLTREPSLAHLRWTVDYPEDLEFVRHVYGALHASNPDFGTAEIAALDWNSSKAPV